MNFHRIAAAFGIVMYRGIFGVARASNLEGISRWFMIVDKLSRQKRLRRTCISFISEEMFREKLGGVAIQLFERIEVVDREQPKIKIPVPTIDPHPNSRPNQGAVARSVSNPYLSEAVRNEILQGGRGIKPQPKKSMAFQPNAWRAAQGSQSLGFERQRSNTYANASLLPLKTCQIPDEIINSAGAGEAFVTPYEMHPSSTWIWTDIVAVEGREAVRKMGCQFLLCQSGSQIIWIIDPT